MGIDWTNRPRLPEDRIIHDGGDRGVSVYSTAFPKRPVALEITSHTPVHDERGHHVSEDVDMVESMVLSREEAELLRDELDVLLR